MVSRENRASICENHDVNNFDGLGRQNLEFLLCFVALNILILKKSLICKWKNSASQPETAKSILVIYPPPTLQFVNAVLHNFLATSIHKSQNGKSFNVLLSQENILICFIRSVILTFLFLVSFVTQKDFKNSKAVLCLLNLFQS